MRNFKSISVVALLAASTAVASEMPCFNDLCFTSWKCHYSRTSKYDKEIDDRCNVPSDVYTPARDGSLWNALVWNRATYLTWTPNYATQLEEIVLEWLMFEGPGTNGKDLQHDTIAQSNIIPCRTDTCERDGHVPCVLERGPQAFQRCLFPECVLSVFDSPHNATNNVADISAATTGWQFIPLLSYFPNEHLNASKAEVIGYGGYRNVFRIYHPNTFDPRNSTTYDLSDPFTMIREEDDNMLRKRGYNRDEAAKKKLAIGVGVGVVATWFVAFLVSWFMSAWFTKRSLQKQGLIYKNVQVGRAD